MASERIYRQSAEVLLGRPARNQVELDLLDLRIRGSLGAPRITGFATRRFQKACLPLNRPIKEFPRNLLQVTCFSFLGTRGTDLAQASKSISIK